MESFWYIVKVMPGKEKSTSVHLNQQISLGNIKNIIRFICPMTNEFVKFKDKKVLREKVIYIGYLYFETIKKLSEDELKKFASIPNIMSINKNKIPILLSKYDVEKIIKDEALSLHNESKINKFNIGEKILIIEGSFSSFDGVISSINGDKIDVIVKIFGRDTEVSLILEQIKKI